GGVVRMDLLIEVCPGQCDDDRTFWPGTAEGFHSAKAAPAMQCDEDVAVFTCILLADDDAVSELSQQAGPAQRGDAVALPRTRRSRRDNADLHDCGAHVRNPAQTSRRSGR